MKIILIFKAFDLTGAPKSMVWVANRLARNGHDVLLLSYFGKECEQPREENVKFHCLNCKVSRHRFVRNTFGMAQAIWRLDRFLSKERPDMVITFLDSVGQVYLLVNRLRNRFKIIASERVDPFSYSRKTAKRLRFFIGLSDGVVFQTEQARAFYRDTPGIYDHSTVIPNPVVCTPKMIELRKNRCGIRDNRIVTAGRLSIKQKRQDVLLRAFAVVCRKHPEMALHIFGEGNDLHLLKEQVKALGLENSVIFAGQSRQIPEDICQARVFALTSDYEGIPNALIEAMMLGVPSVSTDCSPGGARLLIEDGINGYLVPKGDHDLLADRMIRLIEDHDTAEYFSMESVKIAERFSEDTIAQMWCSFVDSVFNESDRRTESD